MEEGILNLHFCASLLILELHSLGFPHISISVLSIQPPLCPRVRYLVFHFVNEKALSDSSRDESISGLAMSQDGRMAPYPIQNGHPAILAIRMGHSSPYLLIGISPASRLQPPQNSRGLRVPKSLKTSQAIIILLKNYFKIKLLY